MPYKMLTLLIFSLFSHLLLALTPPGNGIYEAFTEFDQHLSMYLTIHPDKFKVQLTFKRPHGFFAIAFPVNDQQFRMRNADAFIYGALDGMEKSENAEVREFFLSSHLLEADRRVHFSKMKVIETKKDDDRISVVFERLNEVGVAGISMSNFTADLPMLWAHAYAGDGTQSWRQPASDDIIREHYSSDRGAVVFSLDGAHSVIYASAGVIIHTIMCFLAMGILLPMGSLWDRLKFGTCRKINIISAAVLVLVGSIVGFVSSDEHFANYHSKLSFALLGMFAFYVITQLLRKNVDKEVFSATKLIFDVALVYGMFLLTYFVFTSGVSFLAVSPLVNRGLNILLSTYFAVLTVAVCGPLIHYVRIRSKRYETVGQDMDGPASAEDLENSHAVELGRK